MDTFTAFVVCPEVDLASFFFQLPFTVAFFGFTRDVFVHTLVEDVGLGCRFLQMNRNFCK